MLKDRLKKLRKEKGITQKEISELLNVSRVSYARYETGDRQPPYETLSKIADFFEVSTDYLLGNSNNIKIKNLDRDVVRINVLGSVPAGVPMEAIEDIVDWEEIPSEWNGDYFALKIDGNSMSPKYLNDDVVIFKAQDDIDCGQNALVYVNGYDATFKKVIKKEDGSIILQALNPEYSPIVVKNDETFKVAGIPVEIRRKENL
ncbi:XRE family transcriptional regulator [Erysipelotrichaceae bacterium OttesenSCG-928-M19]|nr:XRE family transcriptional regulator [Erysipelotrichaceae bacterium OttesenSCG-928-M19]